MVEFDGDDDRTLAESIALVRRFKDAGLDFIDVSMGFSTPTAQIPWGPALLAPTARRVKQETGLPTATTWNIHRPALAEEILQQESADLVMLGRPLLANPHWPYVAARELGLDRPSWVLPAPYAHWLARYQTD
jgi:2,4-dienoyl-CoA reductase-like NADH-dependent reductase (Old Yellow Enzyme family)